MCQHRWDLLFPHFRGRMARHFSTTSLNHAHLWITNHNPFRMYSAMNVGTALMNVCAHVRSHKTSYIGSLWTSSLGVRSQENALDLTLGTLILDMLSHLILRRIALTVFVTKTPICVVAIVHQNVSVHKRQGTLHESDILPVKQIPTRDIVLAIAPRRCNTEEHFGCCCLLRNCRSGLRIQHSSHSSQQVCVLLICRKMPRFYVEADTKWWCPSLDSKCPTS